MSGKRVEYYPSIDEVLAGGSKRREEDTGSSAQWSGQELLSDTVQKDKKAIQEYRKEQAKKAAKAAAKAEKGKGKGKEGEEPGKKRGGTIFSSSRHGNKK